MARLRYNGLTATLGADLLTAGTTITFTSALTSAAGAVPTISGTDYIPLAILDANGKPVEIVHLTAYTSGATTGTITRAQESTTAADRASGSTVVNGFTVADATEFASSGGASGTLLSARNSANVTVSTTSYADITGMSVTVTSTGTSDVFLVTAALEVLSNSSVSGASVFYAAFSVAGAAPDDTKAAYYRAPSGAYGSVTVMDRVTGLAAGDHIIKVQAKVSSTQTFVLDSNHSILTVLALA